MASLAKLSGWGARIVALLCIYVGLISADRLLGVGDNGSPLQSLGLAGFTWLGVFTLGYLFSAVGIWIRTGWGFVVAIATAVVELILAMIGDPSVRLPAFEFVMVLLLLVLAGGLFVMVEIRPLFTVHD